MKEIFRKTLAYVIIPGIVIYYVAVACVEAYRFYFCNDWGIEFIKTHPALLSIPFLLFLGIGLMIWVSKVCSKKTIRHIEIIFKTLFAIGVSMVFVWLISITWNGQISLNDIGFFIGMLLISILCWHDVYEIVKND